jgi:hypothetical protein
MARILARAGWHTPARDLAAEFTKRQRRAPTARELDALKRLAKRSNDVFRVFEGRRGPNRADEMDFNTAQNLATFFVIHARGPDNGDPASGKLGGPETTALIKASTDAVPDGSSFWHSFTHAVSSVAHTVAAPVRLAGKEVSKGIHAVEEATSHIPVLGEVVKDTIALSGLGLASNLASGARIDRAVVSDFKNKLAAAKSAAPYAETILSVMPVVGTGVAGAIAFSAALAEGKRIDDALISGLRGSVPGGAVGQLAFDTVGGLVHGKSFTQSALEAARTQLPPEGRAAFDVAVAVYHGKNIQDAALGVAPQLLAAAAPALERALPSVSPAIAGDFARNIGKAINVSNPAWDIAKTGAAFIPGLQTAVPAAMANAAAIGRSEATKTLKLAAARGAVPTDVRHAFDVGLGAVTGHQLGGGDLAAIREKLPGGDRAKGAFDAAIVIASGGDAQTRGRISSALSQPARETFNKVLAVHSRGPAVAVHEMTRPVRGRSRAVRIPIPVSPPNPIRPFPQLTSAQNKVAGAMIANEALRSTPSAAIARTLAVDTRDVRSAIAKFLERFGAARELDFRDVGEMETFDQAARRHNVIAQNLGEWPGDTGEIHVMQLPPIGVDRAALQKLYRRGDSNMRRALLAHELLAHVARNTGELEGTTWRIQGNGDWPSKVAQTVVHDGSRWREILPLNPTFHVMSNGNIPQWTPGTVVQLPPSWFPSAMPVAAAPAPAASSGGPPFSSAYPLGYPSASYRVADGDTGEKVAELITGNKGRWNELLRANPTLAGPHGIELYAGKTIKLPTAWVKPQASAAATAAAQGEATQATADTKPPGVPIEASPPIGGAPAADGRIGSPVDKTGPVLAPPATPATSTSTATTSSATGPVVTGSTEQIAIVQLMLGAFFRDHPDATYSIPSAPYGSQPEDFAGVWTDRTTAAFLGFEKWWNGKRNTPALEADGLPDGDAVQALMAQTNADGGTVDARQPIQLTVKGQQQKAATAPKKKSGGDLVLPIGLLLAALGGG